MIVGLGEVAVPVCPEGQYWSETLRRCTYEGEPSVTAGMEAIAARLAYAAQEAAKQEELEQAARLQAQAEAVAAQIAEQEALEAAAAAELQAKLLAEEEAARQAAAAEQFVIDDVPVQYESCQEPVVGISQYEDVAVPATEKAQLAETTALGIAAQLGLPTESQLAAVYGATIARNIYIMLDQGISPYNIRELDPWTGREHFEYAIPGGPSGNVNITVYDPTTGQSEWVGPSVQPSQVFAASLSFSNTTTGNSGTFRVGDVWRIDITGVPGSQVLLTGSKNGEPFEVVMGTVGSGGSWSKSGSPSEGDIGQWVETWRVGDTTAGTVSFQVVTKEKIVMEPTNGGPAGVNDAAGVPPEDRVDQANGVGFELPPFLKEEWIQGVPNWALLAIGGAGLFLMKKG